MIVCGVPFDATSTQDLKLLRDEINKEITRRENAAMAGEWNTVCRAIERWEKTYGPIKVHGEDSDGKFTTYLSFDKGHIGNFYTDDD